MRPESFEKDHNKIEPGITYTQDQFGSDNQLVFDIRMKKPNSAKIGEKALHSIEHILATLLRDILGISCISVHPMGCQTGFYLITRWLPPLPVIKAIKTAVLVGSSMSAVPGATKKQCGSVELHSLEEAVQELKEFASKIC